MLFSKFQCLFSRLNSKLDELASAGTLDVRCVMTFMLEKKYSVGTSWNGDVPLDEVAFFTTGLTISIELLEWGRIFSGF